jgi:prephenate dehydrogenase
MTDLNGKTVGIVGLGQIGGSLAGALKATGLNIRIIGFDSAKSSADEALKQSIVDVSVDSISGLIEMAEIVILAMPIGAIIHTIHDQATQLRSKLLVTDVGSLMIDVLAAAGNASLNNYVSGHPMAGTEKWGHQAWSSQLFCDCQYFQAALSETTTEARETMNALIAALRARPTEVAPEEHDLAFATTSNLVHVLAFCLKGACDSLSHQVDGYERFIGPSFTDATRVADSDPEMVYQMLWHNRHYLTGALQSLSSELEVVHEALLNDRPGVLRELLGME